MLLVLVPWRECISNKHSVLLCKSSKPNECFTNCLMLSWNLSLAWLLTHSLTHSLAHCLIIFLEHLPDELLLIFSNNNDLPVENMGFSNIIKNIFFLRITISPPTTTAKGQRGTTLHDLTATFSNKCLLWQLQHNTPSVSWRLSVVSFWVENLSGIEKWPLNDFT